MLQVTPNSAVVLSNQADVGKKCVATLPSIFEYLAQESLSGSVKPGIRSILNLLFRSLDRRFNFVDAHFDELYLVLQLFMENYFLKHFSASFSENFYGMKRVPLRLTASFSRIGHRARSLLFIRRGEEILSLQFVSGFNVFVARVVLPYVSGKLERLCEHLRVEQQAKRPKGWRHLFLRFYPSLKALLSVLALSFQIAFVFSLSSIPSPLLLIAKCRLEKLSFEDEARFNAEDQLSSFHLRKTNIFARLLRPLLTFPSLLGHLITYALFLVQFLEFFYSDELGRRFGQLIEGRRNIRIPAHPFNVMTTEQQTHCMEVDKCPICRRPRKNDTVLTVSGYVFCHSCIYNFIRVEGCCPITSLSATSNELVKIFN